MLSKTDVEQFKPAGLCLTWLNSTTMLGKMFLGLKVLPICGVLGMLIEHGGMASGGTLLKGTSKGNNCG